MTRLILAAIILLSACTAQPGNDQTEASADRMVAPILTSPDAKDTQSFARPEVARVTHVALDLDADFEARRMSGTASLDIQAAEGAEEIILDSKGLEIQGIVDEDGQPLAHSLGEGDERRGQPLAVRIGPDTDRIVIRYRSAPNAEALQWLTPEQTAGKRHPYLFSQGQAILNRTWIPTQDSPGIRQTWEARITAPDPLKVVMSGERLTPQGEPAGEGRWAFRFRMDNPVAPYLIAIAAGDLAFRELGPRTGVWTEPAMLDAAARVESMAAIARWGSDDALGLGSRPCEPENGVRA